MKTRYRIMFNGEVYRVQEMALRRFCFGLKRYWKDTTETLGGYGETYTKKLERSDKDSAMYNIENLKMSNIMRHQQRLHMKKFKKENPSGWKKVWP